MDDVFSNPSSSGRNHARYARCTYLKQPCSPGALVCLTLGLRPLVIMSFAGQKVIDFILLLAAVTFTVISTGYVLMLWSIRRDFFIVLR